MNDFFKYLLNFALGLPSFSGFSQPAEPVEDLDFKDNSYGHDQDAYQNDYHSYPATGKDYYSYVLKGLYLFVRLKIPQFL
jgi:hypothetical protein